MVVGCESSAHTIADLTQDHPWEGWSRLPADVWICNLHADELKDPDTEWMFERDTHRLYVGDGLRNLNEYILLGIPETGITGYGTGRVFSHAEEDGIHFHLRVRRRGDREKEMTLVIASTEIAKELKNWVSLLPPFDD